MTDPPRPEDPDDGIRYPDSRPFRRIQLATGALIVVAVLVTLFSDKRPAEVRYGALIGVAVLILVILWATRRRRARRAPALEAGIKPLEMAGIWRGMTTVSPDLAHSCNSTQGGIGSRIPRDRTDLRDPTVRAPRA